MNQEKVKQKLCNKRERTSMDLEGEAVSDGITADALDERSYQQDGVDCLEKESLNAFNAIKRFCRRC